MKKQHTPRRRPMVGWFDPRVLAHSAYLVAISNVFGRHSDTRLIEALASQPQNEFDYSQASGDFWLDYVADIGDGWNPTYAIADAIAQPELDVTDDNGVRVKTQPGRVLIFGGDEVYPYPTRAEYDMRTETPYRLAFAGRERPDLFAIPGNHDWYDSLIAFSRQRLRWERDAVRVRFRKHFDFINPLSARFNLLELVHQLEFIVFRRDHASPEYVIRTPVAIGRRTQDTVEVLSGVGAGDELVRDGIHQLKQTGVGRPSAKGHFHADGTWHEGDK